MAHPFVWWLQAKSLFSLSRHYYPFFRSKSSIVSPPPPSLSPFLSPPRGGTTKCVPADYDGTKKSVELTRKSPYSWWTRWLRQTLRSRRMSPCTEEQKRTPSDSDVEVYPWHGRNRPCPIWALAPRPTLLWPPMWDIPLKGCMAAADVRLPNCHILTLVYNTVFNAELLNRRQTSPLVQYAALLCGRHSSTQHM